MTIDNAQKFIGKHRPGVVQIEYDLEVGGAKKVVNLPWKNAIMANLSGASKQPKQKVGKRKFHEIDARHFDTFMKTIKPKVKYDVPNRLTGKGQFEVDITFENMDDFRPDKIVKKVKELNNLLKERTRLKNLLNHMGGKEEVEELIGKILKDPEYMKLLAPTPASTESTSEEV